MAKLRATSVQDSLTITTTNASAKGLILSDGSNNSSVNFKNNNGILKINFTGLPGGANPSINAENCNVNVGKTLSAKSISLPSGEITIDDTFNGDGNLVFSGIDINRETLPNSIDETVQSGDYISVKNSSPTMLSNELDINNGVDNSVFSNIEDIIYETDGSYMELSSIQTNKKYTWVLKIEDAKSNFVTADVNVNLSVNLSLGGSARQYYKISIDKTNLNSATFKGPIKKISLNTKNPNVTDAEDRALKNVTIKIQLKMKRYRANNILIGSYSDSVKKNKNNLTETVGIGNKVSPSSNYPLDIAAGGNHLKMDSEGALSFGKVIVDSSTLSRNVTLNELGLFIINFSFNQDQTYPRFTAILSRITTAAGNSTSATDSGGYRLECNSNGKFIIHNSNGGEISSDWYIEKIIKIMSY